MFQFPFFSRSVFRDRHEFLHRLIPFLRELPSAVGLQSRSAPITAPATFHFAEFLVSSRNRNVCQIAPNEMPIANITDKLRRKGSYERTAAIGQIEIRGGGIWRMRDGLPAEKGSTTETMAQNGKANARAAHCIVGAWLAVMRA